MTIPVDDPFGAASDPALPALRLALDPVEAKKQFKRRLPHLSGEGKLRLQAIRVTRHKAGRRCVIEYDVRIDRPGCEPASLTLIGKIRARRFGNESFRLQQQFWQSGFAADSPDGISVPEPLGVISAFRMWVQRKVPGEPYHRVLKLAQRVDLARRIAQAIHKVHLANVPTDRSHRMADELRILQQCLAKVGELKPEWAQRLEALEKRCLALGLSVPEPKEYGIHRDFY
ncbi:MAG TPA: aminoglycoside phosphotransferase family protein, partial [Verrucomicrobiae bacterium]